VGRRSGPAAAAVAKAHLAATIVEREADDPASVVVAQSPAPGSFLHDGGHVQLVVSRGPPPVAVPDVTAPLLSVEDATRRLSQARFAVVLNHQYNDSVRRGDVIGTDPPAGKPAKPESTVSLLVSDGQQPVAVPDVSQAKSYDEAAQILVAKRLNPVRRDDFSPLPVGQVLGTEPGVGTDAAPGATVTVVVSKGPEMVTVPDVRTKTCEAALTLLESAGLVGTCQNAGTGHTTVAAQSPERGTSVPKGTSVTLFF
jgi:serine/threonine-protein kinase